jgi:hypothetical protein
MERPLICHPDTPARGVAGIIAVLDGTRLRYRVEGADALCLPPAAAPERTDGLWRTTCFELFVQPAAGTGYLEFNIAPSGQWAAYRFDGYRAGMRDLDLAAPLQIRRSGDAWQVDLPAPLPIGRVGLAAVIEELDGTRSYWALAHPPGAPDFHHPDCFAIDLAAPQRP